MYILTRSGKQFSFSSPSPDAVVLDDVAYALAAINRFTGHTVYPYSVAQHSVAVSQYLEATGAELRVQLAGLLHDAHEAYFGDIAAPLKAFLGVGAQEDRIQEVVGKAFAMPLTMLKHPQVKQADLVALAVERDVLMPQDVETWSILSSVTAEMKARMPKPYPAASVAAAAQTFIARYEQLMSEKYQVPISLAA